MYLRLNLVVLGLLVLVGLFCLDLIKCTRIKVYYWLRLAQTWLISWMVVTFDLFPGLLITYYFFHCVYVGQYAYWWSRLVCELIAKI